MQIQIYFCLCLILIRFDKCMKLHLFVVDVFFCIKNARKNFCHKFQWVELMKCIDWLLFRRLLRMVFLFQIKFINIQLNTCTIWTVGSLYTCRLNFASACVYLIIISRLCAISMLWSGCVCNESIFVCTKQQLRMQPIIYLILMKYSISLTNIFQFASISDAVPFENSMHLSVDRPKSILFSHIFVLVRLLFYQH